jgi:hypothetical protein
LRCRDSRLRLMHWEQNMCWHLVMITSFCMRAFGGRRAGQCSRSGVARGGGQLGALWDRNRWQAGARTPVAAHAVCGCTYMASRHPEAGLPGPLDPKAAKLQAHGQPSRMPKGAAPHPTFSLPGGTPTCRWWHTLHMTILRSARHSACSSSAGASRLRRGLSDCCASFCGRRGSAVVSVCLVGAGRM